MRGSFSSTLLVLLLGVSCAEPPRSNRAEGGFRVAFLTPVPISDQAWNGEACRGLVALRDSIRASISHIQIRTSSSFSENFRGYGRQGYDLVIGHGFEYQDAAKRVAPSFPETVFLVVSSEASAANVAGIKFAFAQPAFLAGMAAAGASKTGVIGAIGGTELPPVREGFDAYIAGVRTMDPDIRVLVSYVGNWEDVCAGREQALAQMAQRADVIFQNADATGLGVFQAARESGRAIAIGSNANQNDVTPGVVLGSAVIDLPRAFLTAAGLVRNQATLPGVFALGAESGVVRFALNRALEGRITPAVRQKMDSVWTLMQAGTWQSPVSWQTTPPGP